MFQRNSDFDKKVTPIISMFAIVLAGFAGGVGLMGFFMVGNPFLFLIGAGNLVLAFFLVYIRDKTGAGWNKDESK